MKICFLLIILFISLNITGTVLAQTVQSNLVITKIGNAIDEQKPAISNPSPGQTVITPPGDSSKLAGIVSWDEKIVNSLEQGLWGYFNRKSTEDTNGNYSTGTWPSTNGGNLYWCTYSIVDAYRLAGVDGLSKSAHAAVVNMQQFWATKGVTEFGFKYLDYYDSSTSIKSLSPGFAMFMERSPGQFTGSEHVNLIKEVIIDDQGNGYFITLDSNSSSKTRKYTVAGFKVLNTIYPVVGFGGV